jgi:mono/diheme cytochrome c family protein
MGMRGGCPMGNMSMLRHRYVMMNGIGPRYAAKTNPLPGTAPNIAAGKALYGTYCASCHGLTGLGDTKIGQNLNPPAPNIALIGRMPMATDGYLYWTIAEGGVPLNTPMPAFKGLLKEKQIWQTILFLREL